MRQHQLQGAIYCLTATASWGAMFPVMTGALVHIDPFTFTSLRYLIAGAAFLAVLIFKEGWCAVHFKGERMLAAWLFGTAGFAGFNFLICASTVTGASDGFDRCGVRQCCSTARVRRMSEMCLINKEERDYA